ncbi:hypothetical protein MK805_11785 [Shimazuella sp. AN120528]|uniref:hypothetical protein n=1 Tax=Shimazuella soli TaxID=1892854 RepID=UPI001F0E03AB|nr:hypothetical protein [Shimazuella soli]MCH5585625.1 hypothetical protein [Shimazuella soli]
MKSIYISYSDDNVQQKIKTIGKVGHNLENLWLKVEPIIKEANSSKDDDTLLIVQDYILQFHKFDGRSFKFRYPINKRLEPMLEKEHFIDLVNLKKRMDELENFFSGVDGQLDHIRSFKQEWESEMKRYYEYY